MKNTGKTGRIRALLGRLPKRKKKEIDPVKEAKAAKRAAIGNRFALLWHFLGSFAGYFLIEAMARHSFREAWTFLDERTKVFLYNTFLIFVTTLPAFLLRKRAFYRVLIAAFWLLLGISNGVTLANRVTPLTGPDIMLISDLGKVVNKYFSGAEVILVIVAAVIGLLLLLWYLIISPRYKGKMYWRFAIPGVAAAFVLLALFTQLGLKTRQLSSYFSNIAFAYRDYGFPYALAVTVFDTGISQPNGYSDELVEQIIRSEGKIKETVAEEDRPNIVVVQLESFFDPGRIRWLDMSEDPIPNWHALAKKYSSGYYIVPTVGAGTVNTEFEMLTGMSLRFFGAGEYPYKGILRKETCESMAYDLGRLGYTSHAIHNNESNFYGRRQVYSRLGFHSFTSGEYMDTQDDVNENGWMRDRNLVSCIADALDSTENRDFVFTVTVQPHGGYPTEPTIEDPAITVSGALTPEKNSQWEYYVNQIYEEDQFVGALVDYLEERDEPTVCFFYGDHLPTLGIEDRELKGGATTFDTNWLMWDNLGFKRKTRKVRAYQAAALLMDRIGIHEGVMFRYHQTMQRDENYLSNMQVLQYDLLYGRRYAYGEVNPWDRTVLSLGVKPVRLDRVTPSLYEGQWYVAGQNFTQSCRVQVGGDLVETTYVDNRTLLVRDTEIRDGQKVSVAVQSNSSTHKILTKSNTLVYGVGWLVDQVPEPESEEEAVSAASETSQAGSGTVSVPDVTPTPEIEMPDVRDEDAQEET